MERKEYEILLKEWDGPYDLITNKQKGWYTGHARIADRKTTLRWDWGFGIEHGLWIAILPIDNFPEEDCEWISFKKKLDLAMYLGKLKNVVWVDSVGTIRNIIRILLKWLLLPIPYSFVSDKINNTLQRYNKLNTHRKANISTYLISTKPNKWPQVFDAKCLDDYIDVEFEGGTFESMQYPESYLEATYGDWRQLPPEKDRVPQHGYVAYWK